MSTATTGVAQRVVTLDDLATLVGEHLGISRWYTVTQRQVDLFAEATGDHQWIHTDPERARSGPFGATVAVNSVERTPRWTQCAFGLVHDGEGTAKSACVAEIVFRYYRQET